MGIRPAAAAELPLLQDIERAAGEPFRSLGMAAIADDEPPALDLLEHCRREGRAWVAADDEGHPLAYLIHDEVDGTAHVEQVSVHPAAAHRRLGRGLIDHLGVRAAGQRPGRAHADDVRRGPVERPLLRAPGLPGPRRGGAHRGPAADQARGEGVRPRPLAAGVHAPGAVSLRACRVTSDRASTPWDAPFPRCRNAPVAPLQGHPGALESHAPDRVRFPIEDHPTGSQPRAYRSRSSIFRTLPLTVIGKVSTISSRRGTL